MSCSESSVVEAGIFGDMCHYCQRYDLLNMMHDALVLIDSRDGTILFMNENALEMYQYTIEEVTKLSINQISHDSAALTRESLQSAKRRAKGYVFTSNHIKKDGSIFQVEISTRYMAFHGSYIFASVVRNLTPQLKMRREVELAGKVQRHLLPRDIVHELFEVQSIYQPHGYVSGDLYDFIFDKDKMILHGIIIDVMGHGIAATAQTGVLKYLFMQAKEKKIPLHARLGWINREVMTFFEGGGFAAAFLFEFDFSSNILTYSAGGINHFIVINAQGTEIIKAPGLFLGINEKEIFDQKTLQFTSGDSFLFLTDGLFELLPKSLDKELDFDGMQTLCKTLALDGKHRDDASSVGIQIL